MDIRKAILQKYSRVKYSRHLDIVRHVGTILGGTTAPSWPKLLDAAFLAQRKRVLVLAPHPDDEIFGMGGTILTFLGLGSLVEIIWLTNAANLVRVGESMTVLRELGLQANPQTAFPLPASNMYVAEAAMAIQDAVFRFKPDTIGVPSVFDPHYDHIRLGHALKAAIAAIAWQGTVLQYEVWNTLIPNALVDISKVVESKRRLMRIYASQTEEPNRKYMERLLALNHYRGLVHKIEYAEGYIVSDAKEFCTLIPTGL